MTVVLPRLRFGLVCGAAKRQLVARLAQCQFDEMMLRRQHAHGVGGRDVAGDEERLAAAAAEVEGAALAAAGWSSKGTAIASASSKERPSCARCACNLRITAR